jgi:hypothetical protein
MTSRTIGLHHAATALAVAALLSLAGTAPAETPAFGAAIAVGGTLGDRGNAVALDPTGNAYVTGFFSDTVDFDPGPGDATLTSAGENDAFLCKYAPDGSLVWARAFGGAGSDISYGVGLDASGGVYLTGYFNGSVDFDPGPGDATLASAGDDDIFVCKFDTGGVFQWARRAGGNNSDRASALAVDAAGNVHAIGWFRNTVDFDPGAGSADLTASSSGDVFIWKLDASGALVWARNLGGSSQDFGFGIALDGGGAVYTAGYFLGTCDFDPGVGTLNIASAGAEDAFVCKLDAAGSLVWARTLGGPGNDRAFGVVPDGSGGAYLTGHVTGAVDLDPGAGTIAAVNAGGVDAFVLRLDANVDAAWATSFGSASDDRGFALALDGAGDLLATGYFQGSLNVGIHALASAGVEDAYVAKFWPDGTALWAASLGGTGFDEGRAVAADSTDGVYLTGGFSATATFAPAGGDTLQSQGDRDVFLLRVDPQPDPGEGEGEGEGEAEGELPSPNVPVGALPLIPALLIAGALVLRHRNG